MCPSFDVRFSSLYTNEKVLLIDYFSHVYVLADPIKGAELHWKKHCRIIEGITLGPLYLHKYSRFRDLKTSNILLDGEMNPRYQTLVWLGILEGMNPKPILTGWLAHGK